jgi:hypothetical protein
MVHLELGDIFEDPTIEMKGSTIVLYYKNDLLYDPEYT